PSAKSGVQLLDADGTGPLPPVRVYCDMSTDDGGWTLVHKNNQSSTNDRTDDGFNVEALADPTVNDVAVLPRAVMAALSPLSEFRVIATNGYKIYSLGGYPYYTTDQHDGQAHSGSMKYDWASAYFPQVRQALQAGMMHAPLVCPEPTGCTGADSGHMAIQRWCFGAPKPWFCFNGQQRFAAGYYAGTGWVRWV